MQDKFFKKSSIYKSNNKSVHWINYVATGVLLIVIGLFLYRFIFFIPVFINGKWIKVPLGTTVQKAIAKEKIVLERGDLKDTKGKLLKKGEGRAPGVFVNDNEVPFSRVLHRGDKITVRPGVDIVEEVERRVEVIAPATYIKGQGAFLAVSTTGHPGMKVVNVGARSGRIISEEIIRPVKPVILERMKYTNGPMVALTFDDGPSPLYTPQILSILQSQQVPATFFVIGSQARKYPDIMRLITASGCVVGNHSYSHAMLGDAPASTISTEIENAENVIKETTGVGTTWFRPPGGSTSINVVETASIQGCKTVLWSVDPLDWMRPPPQVIVDRVLGQLHPGAVILLHDGGGDRTATIQALPMIIEQLRLRGYSFVTLDKISGNQ